MSDQQSVVRGVNQLLGLSADLCAADTVAEAIEEAVGLGEAVFDHTVVRVCRTSMAGECDTLAASGEEQATATELVQTLCEREPTGHPTAHTQTPPVDAIETELLVPVAGRRVLRVGSRETGTVDDKDKAGAEQLARLLTQHIRRLESKDTGAVDEPTHILRRFHEITIGADDFETTVEKVLTLGPDYLGVETGVVSRIDETYTIEAVVDQTNTYTQGSTATLESDLCAEVVSRDTITPLAIADVTASELDPNPVADAIGAYLGAPIIVDGEPYGTVNFTSPTAHPREFNEEDREFVTLVAQWLGTEIERNRHVAELERDEAILEAVGDPVYAVDSDGRFTFLNESAEELFGPTEDRLGNPVGDVLSDAASRQFNDQFDQLSEQSHRSTTEAFTITTATGDCRTVENRLAQISENHGAAGVLRDVTERNRRRQQLESFKRAIEDSVDGVAILEDEEFVFVDDTHVEMYGFESQDELLGGTWRQLYGPEEIKRLESEVFPELADSGHWNGKVRGHRSDGSTFPAEVSLTLVEHGRLVCTVRDETEQREREQELKLKDRAMDATDVGIQITDATQAENPLVYVNEGFEQITGYSRDEALGRNPRFLQGEDSESEQLERLRSAIAAEETVAVELKNYRKDGTSYWSHLSVTPVRDETGQVTNYIGIQQDITEYREVRQELREQRERLELTLSETGTGVAEWDLETGTVTWNETLVDMFGRDITNIEEFFDGVHPQDRPTVQSGLERMTNTGRPWIGEFRLQTDIGEYRWLGARAVELEREGSTVLAVGTDITERKERERALEALYESTRDLIDVDRPAEAFEAGISALDDIPGLTVTGVYRRQNDILVRVSEAESGPVEAPDRVTRGQTPLWEAIEQGSPVRYDDVANIDDGIDRGSVTSSAYFPIGDHGVIAVGATTEGHPNESQRQLIEVLTRNLAAVLDALERQRSLRASERRYRTLAEHIPNGGVVLFDDDQQIRLAAGELLEDFGVHEGDAVGIITDDDDQRLATWCAAALEGDRTDQRIKRGGQTLRMQVVPIDSGEGTASGLILAQDITAKVRREQELARERERFRMLIEGVDEYAFFITDETGAIQTWNAGAERLFGYDTAAALGISVAQLYTADDRARGRPDRILQQARIAGESADEGWRVCADGSQFYADSRYASLETEAGEFRGFAHIVRDMTERRRQRRRTELFVTESTDVVTIIEPDGTIEYVSRSVTEILGYGPDALVGENLFDYVHPEDREAAMSAFFESVGSPGADFDFEGRFKSGDGEWRNVDGQGQNMVEEEAIDGLLLYLSDITDAKQRARRFEGIFNQTFQLIGLLNPDGTIIEANDTALAFGGFDRDEVIGTRLCELSWYDNSDTAGQVTEAVDRAADGEFVRYETELQGTDGLATIDFSLKPIVDEADDVTMLVAEGRDITDRQRQRRQLGVMHRVIRHNMRNDLTKVRGWAEMLAETTDPEQRAVTLKTIGEVLDKWSRMTEQMRKIQRILQADREQETLVDPATLLDRLADAVTEEYPEATVETTDLEAGGTQIPALVGEAVTELLENAIAASPTQTVTAACRRPSADWLEVIISDDGPGLPEMEARVLETGEETPLNHGEGLGLWLVRTAVTQVGGDVAVDVYPDGTDVRLRLPVRRRTDH